MRVKRPRLSSVKLSALPAAPIENVIATYPLVVAGPMKNKLPIMKMAKERDERHGTA